MTVNKCIEQLLEIEENRKESLYNENTIAIGVARIGSDSQKIVSGTLKELLCVDFGEPLHSLILPGKMHFLEADVVKTFAVDKDTFELHADVSDH